MWPISGGWLLQPRGGSSLRKESKGTLILDYSASRIVRKKCLLKPPSLRCFVKSRPSKAGMELSVDFSCLPFETPKPLEISQLRLQTSCSRDKSYLLPCQSCWLIKSLSRVGFPGDSGLKNPPANIGHNSATRRSLSSNKDPAQPQINTF